MQNITRKYKISFLLIFILFMSNVCFAETELEKATREQLMEILNDEQVVNDFMKEILRREKREPYRPISKKLRETSAVEMVIITNDEYKNAFEVFANIKKSEGINTDVVSTSAIGETTAEIRNWLWVRKIVNPDLMYVLIGGDENAVPIKDFTYYQNGAPHLATTDFYYSNVLSNWPLDDDIYDIDPHTDLYVGRVPARCEEEVIMFIDKYNSYRKSHTQYTDAMTFIATNILKIKNSATDNIVIDSIASHVPDYISKDMIYNYDLIDTLNGCAQPIVDELNNRDFSFLYLSCHGGGAYCIYNSEYDDDSTWVWRSFGPNKRNNITISTRHVSEGGCWYNDFTGDSTDYYYTSPPEKYWQLEDNVPDSYGQNYVAWIASCYTTDLGNCISAAQPVLRDSSGEIIQTHHYPEQPGDGPIRIPDSEVPDWEENDVQCVSEAFFNEFGGPVALYSSSSMDYPYLTDILVQEYFDMLFEYNLHTLGLLTRDCWTIWFQYFQNLRVLKEIYVGYTLFGDPSMQIWSQKAEKLVTIHKPGGFGGSHIYTFKSLDSSGNPVPATIVVLDEEMNILGKGTSPYTYKGTITDNSIITSNSPNYIQSMNKYYEIKEYSGLPYEMTFEEGIDNNWEMFNSNEYGRTIITDEYEPYSGRKHLIMDVNTDSHYSTNEAWLHLSLENQKGVVISFFWKEFDDEDHFEDGVFISDKGGGYFEKIYSLKDNKNKWERVVIELDKIVREFGMRYTDDFVIKFQHYDNDKIPRDGFAFDDINVYSNSKDPGLEKTVSKAAINLANYPNPFNSETSISFSLKEHSHVNIEIYNVKGERVSTIMNESRDSGIHTFRWDGTDLSAGIYFIKLMVNGKVTDIHKTIILR